MGTPHLCTSCGATCTGPPRQAPTALRTGKTDDWCPWGYKYNVGKTGKVSGPIRDHRHRCNVACIKHWTARQCLDWAERTPVTIRGRETRRMRLVKLTAEERMTRQEKEQKGVLAWL